jgi:hypothetical protein
MSQNYGDEGETAETYSGDQAHKVGSGQNIFNDTNPTLRLFASDLK